MVQVASSMNRASSKRRFRRRLVPWLFVLPILLIHLVVIIGPSISAFYYSLTDWSGVGLAKFIGLENFRFLFFEDKDFKHAFLNNLTWLGIALTFLSFFLWARPAWSPG